MAGVSAFCRAGYPTIATVGGFFIFFYTIYYSAAKTGFGGWRNHGVWFFFNFWLWLFGLFLVFGPDSLAALPLVVGGYDGYPAGFGPTQLGPRSAIIGLQLMVQASIGAFAIFSANAYASLVFALIGLFNELCLIGSLYFFNYNQPIWVLTSNQCNLYFSQGQTDSYGNPDTYTRCHDDGYLEVIRVFGTLEILINGFLIVISLLAYATAIPAPAVAGAGYPAAGYPAGAPAAGYPAGSTSGYAPGPSYASATAGPGFVAQTAGQPVISNTVNTPYTTTTSVPATTTTTTTREM